MAVAMMADNPEGTQEIYEECESGSAWRRLPRHLPHRRAESEGRLAGDRGLRVRGGREAVRQEAHAAGLRCTGAPPPPPPHLLARAKLHGIASPPHRS